MRVPDAMMNATISKRAATVIGLSASRQVYVSAPYDRRLHASVIRKKDEYSREGDKRQYNKRRVPLQCDSFRSACPLNDVFIVLKCANVAKKTKSRRTMALCATEIVELFYYCAFAVFVWPETGAGHIHRIVFAFNKFKFVKSNTCAVTSDYLLMRYPNIEPIFRHSVEANSCL